MRINIIIITRPLKVIWEQRVALAQLCNEVPIAYSGTPHIYPKTAHSLRRSPPHLINPSLDRPYSSPQTASGSNQLFCRSTLSGQRHRPTDGTGDKPVPRALTLRIVIDALLIRYLYSTIKSYMGHRGAVVHIELSVITTNCLICRDLQNSKHLFPVETCMLSKRRQV